MVSFAQKVWDSAVGRDTTSPKIMEEANEFLVWSRAPYHKKFLDWLYAHSDAPLNTSLGHAELIAFTARANTFKEIRRYLQDEEARANIALDREQYG